ncbi:5708_t:CDS:2 [Gigaspora margarita]|uniref:5708_t:CDS:1 n=1 Tax=Gigaspora margarita TaxID=4874 RepID=A0ABN7UUG9_GIGMA|nr:5708_t:CDS:2 [Gigaspora margarita]
MALVMVISSSPQLIFANRAPEYQKIYIANSVWKNQQSVQLNLIKMYDISKNKYKMYDKNFIFIENFS